ncbi:MAG: alkyl hydroperoxide reductase/Thiol specific antioxidant/Mal allergen [Amycolatopsis sp.]|uniref:cytochrome c biogenesis protein DipZ n=1 Tax=Amycolatopsis sp. TaxID=37632 RepID=UPI00262E3D15|nr:cytochrome c biogenesis protein DipZ [Amycolatopsis sp.]MCU1684544.1 alkyl hydroperoxide reductase/Thiol specific antioxidant/Mal allergen [Amycolatopsis sp.]
MITLVIVGFLAGVITSISPCVLPVLPVVLTSGAVRRGAGTGEAGATGDTEAAEPVRTRSWRPYGVVAGLVVSFSLSTLFGSLVLSALHLPQTLLRDAGIVVLVIIGLGLIFHRVGDLLERPFARLRGRPVNPDSNGLVVGLGLGLLFVPCAGPVLATIAVVGASHHVGFGAVVLTIAFGVGTGVPLLILALAGNALARRTGFLRRRAPALRISAGVVMIVVAALIGFNLTDGLQRSVPGYTAALQQSVEGDPGATNQLHQLTSGGGSATATGVGNTCTETEPTLQDCGTAPAFTGINGWLNTPGDKPLTLAGLRGKVVLIDFWTYSCINCQRTLPHLEAWSRAYVNAGLVVIGVHTPEFAFEHDTANVTQQAHSLGVNYPIAIDNDYGTWNAYANQYWPAEYLIDQSGQIRHTNFGEGDYGGTEELIRQLLSDSATSGSLPPATEVPDTTPTEQQTPETYLGYQYAPLHTSGQAPQQGQSQPYDFPPGLEADTFALSGTWNAQPEQITAGPDAKLELDYEASDVYLVLGGTGTVAVQVNGKTSSITVSGPPKFYTLVSGPTAQHAVLSLSATPGVQAYDFTFG